MQVDGGQALMDWAFHTPYYCAEDPDAWQGEMPPEWEPEACEHPRYTSAWLAWQDRLVFGDWFAEPKKRSWVSDRLMGEVGG